MSESTSPSPIHSTNSTTHLQQRTLRVLIASQVLGGIGVGSGIAVVGLLAYELSGTESLSGVSATASTLGAAGASVFIALLAVRRGRRPGLVLGYLVGAAGAALAVVAAVLDAFWLHVLASAAFGAASASNLQARYAATDLAEPDRRARTLSTVVWATTVGAVLGPNLTGPGGQIAEAVSLPPLAGAYVFSLAAFLAAATVQAVGLRPDPLLTARATRGLPTPAALGPGRERGATGPPPPRRRGGLATIRAIPAAMTALVAIATAHGVMVGIMVMTPVHLEHHGAALRLVGLTISLHIAGMYALSPVMGWLADRYGRRRVLWCGLVQLAAAALLAALADPTGPIAFQGGLVLLGTGWSACLVSASTLLTEVVPVEERPAAQGASDLVMHLAGGVAGIIAGVVLAVGSFPGLALSALAALGVPAWRLARHGQGLLRVPVAEG